jgi:hypothetical protein
MKRCPHCSESLGFLTIVCHQDVVVCPGCKAELIPDNRSIVLLYIALAAYVPLVMLLIKYLRGLTFGWAALVGFCAGLLGAVIATTVFACCVRLRVKGARDRAQTASAHP